MFSTTVMPSEYYREAIEAYLFRHHNANIQQVISKEQGVIPMGSLGLHDPAIPGLGVNGVALFVLPAATRLRLFISKLRRPLNGSRTENH